MLNRILSFKKLKPRSKKARKLDAVRKEKNDRLNLSRYVKFAKSGGGDKN